MISSLASKCQHFKLRGLQFHYIKWLKNGHSNFKVLVFDATTLHYKQAKLHKDMQHSVYDIWKTLWMINYDMIIVHRIKWTYPNSNWVTIWHLKNTLNDKLWHDSYVILNPTWSPFKVYGVYGRMNFFHFFHFNSIEVFFNTHTG